MKRLSWVLVTIAVILIITATMINIYLVFKLDEKQERYNADNTKVINGIIAKNQSINQKIDNIQSIAEYYAAPKDGKDGKDGANGKDGVSIKGDKGDTVVNNIYGKDGEDGHDGLTPEIRCNTVKNRWEIRYVGDVIWKIMDNNIAPCTISKQDIIDAINSVNSQP